MYHSTLGVRVIKKRRTYSSESVTLSIACFYRCPINCIHPAGVQGYLAHNKSFPPLGLPQGPRHSPTVGSSGGAVSDERGTPVSLGVLLTPLYISVPFFLAQLRLYNELDAWCCRGPHHPPLHLSTLLPLPGAVTGVQHTACILQGHHCTCS